MKLIGSEYPFPLLCEVEWRLVSILCTLTGREGEKGRGREGGKEGKKEGEREGERDTEERLTSATNFFILFWMMRAAISSGAAALSKLSES